MKFTLESSAKKLWFFVLACTSLLLSSFAASGQSYKIAKKQVDSLNQLYYSKQLSQDDYLDAVEKMLADHLSKGVHFSIQQLTDLQSVYKEIAWSTKEYDGVRKNYYIGFLNNAAMFEQSGAHMYYADKIALEYKKNGELPPFIVVLAKSQIYMQQGVYDKIISLYQQQKDYLKTLPGLLRKDKIDVATGIDALTFMCSGALASYIMKDDTLGVQETSELTYQIGNEISTKSRVNKTYMLYNDFFMLVTQYSVALFKKDYDEVKRILDRLENLKNKYKQLDTTILDQNALPWKIHYYLTIGNADSAAFYIDKFEKQQIYGKNQKYSIYKYKAELYKIKGDFERSNKLLYSAIEEGEKVQENLKAEMDNFLYAYTEAENTRIELQQAEEVKKQRTLWLVIISVNAAIIILSIYLLMRYRSRKAKARIESLNNMADMQIIAMEESKHQAVREEQQRLGQDLHDGLSSSIAAVRYQLEALILDTEDMELKNKLSNLKTDTVKAYEAARSKSHEWFNAGDEQGQLSFEKQIKVLTEKALPDNHYTKKIHIDNESLSGVSTDIRIALLRIIQESITNIIKHAKAKSVDILLYVENDELILCISDDGIGFESKMKNKKSMLGLESIRRRVLSMNGNTDVQSDKKGTTIKVSIPLF